MKAFRLTILAATAGCLGLASFVARPVCAANRGLVQVEEGALRGAVTGSVVEFRGIPYAAPPVGPRRFAPPVPSERWAGVRDATHFAATCPQGQATNEDCLYLNITAPSGPTGQKLPVMVWLHGGGFSAGTPDTYDASELVTQGKVIFVGIEFRVNVFGLLALPDMPGAGNLIFQDQQAALRWIRRNIAAFGGDPGNVTLFGESGGAIATCAQLTSPQARGLFHRVILQSGSCSTSFAANFVSRGVPAGAYFAPLAEAERQGTALSKTLGCAARDGRAALACLRRQPTNKVAKAGAALISAAYSTPTLPIDPQEAVVEQKIEQISVLTGFTRQEGLAMVAGMQLSGAPISAADYPRLVNDVFGRHAGKVESRYPLTKFGGRGDLAWAAIITDRMFACAQLHDAKAMAGHAPVYVYEFADPQGVGLIPMPPDLPRGPSHSSELPLLFRLADGPLDIATGRKIERTEAQRKLSARMIATWAQFAKTGDPSSTSFGAWPRFLPASQLVTWLTTPGAPGPSDDPWSSHHCAMWESVAAH